MQIRLGGTGVEAVRNWAYLLSVEQDLQRFQAVLKNLLDGYKCRFNCIFYGMQGADKINLYYIYD